MKNNFGNCKGKSGQSYNGPTLTASFKVAKVKYVDGVKQVIPGKYRHFKETARMNNPRKTEDAVRMELCAKVKRNTPDAILVGWTTKGV